MHAVVSVDGFIADVEDSVGPLFEWYFNGDAEIVRRWAVQGLQRLGPLRASDVAANRNDSHGQAPLRSDQRVGRHSAGWRTHRGCDAWAATGRLASEASCQFIDDVGRAIRVAKELAGDRDVAVT